MGEDPPLHTIIKAFAIFVVAISRRDFAIRAFVVTVQRAGIPHAIRAVTLLDIPVQRAIVESHPVHADTVHRAIVLTGIQAIVGPRLRQEFIQWHADGKRQQLVVVIGLCTSTAG